MLAITAFLVWPALLQGKEVNDVKCSRICRNSKLLKPHPPLVVISLDGYSQRYLSRRMQPTFDRIAECGVMAEKVFPSFPTLTYPNHVTIATGLYPGHHGIVANTLYDVNVSSQAEHLGKSIRDGFYTKEPIWSLYQRQTKRKAATISWIGSYHNSSYYLQPHYMVPFTEGIHPNEKLDQALKWLKLSDDKRPGLIMVYITEPDHTGHLSTGENDGKLNDAIVLVEGALRNFLAKLKDQGMLECINIVIVSDHGMAEIKNNGVLEELFSLKDMVVSTGVNTLIFRRNSTVSHQEIMSALTCKGTDHVRVFNKTTVPLRFHYSESERIGDYIIVGQRDTNMYSTTKEVNPRKKGAHGFDYIQSDMHTIMFARGPSFKEKVVLPPYLTVEYMNLWTKLLHLPPHENDGEPDFMNLALIDGERKVRVRHDFPVRKCGMTHDTPSLNDTYGNCTSKDKEQLISWVKCPITGASAAVSIATDGQDLCYVAGCNDMAVIDASTDDGFLATLIEIYDTKNNEPLLSSECTFHLMNRSHSCQRPNISEQMEYRTLSAFPTRVLAHERNLIIPWKANFIRGRDFPVPSEISRTPYCTEILDPLNDYTQKIVTKLGRVLSITGTAYDEDYDGKYSSPRTSSQYPTHLFRILVACGNGGWSNAGPFCNRTEETKALSFVFPHMDADPNCLPKHELLLQYTARIKDVESISGQHFNFTNVSDMRQMLLKMHINSELW
ncbi:hypothetical protein Y032_0033g2750 [Ancylostoma ceylanicum]|uniref:Type I phosphodiesterase / nucleotide pyrophosphatase n=1 Tax=Ancylostoma ceylanicum TaxID=53326 RepID=A0A016UNW9_9BILA|nr:hypothetical protein Y032_0033g2750 [Ancylostoma ceylanicum]